MQLGSLRVVHLSKESVAPFGYEPEGLAFVLDSCQRVLWIEEDRDTRPPPPFELYRGLNAYAFLLSVATGLESQVIGETDIFGQLKEAWKQQNQSLAPSFRRSLSPWMQRLFEDTKEIRSLYLQSLGGSSYGSLLRKLLKDHESFARGPTLLIGAGQLAHSVAPYLLDHELLIANRGASRASELSVELLEQNQAARVRVLRDFEEELFESRQAAQVILCVPLDPERDPARVAALAQSNTCVVHLGARASELGLWTKLRGIHSLDEIFQIEKSVHAIRSVQVERARFACREKAMLRSLGGGSSSIAHGWEDLAAFGS